MTSFYLQYMFSSPLTAKQVHIIPPRCLCTGFAELWGIRLSPFLAPCVILPSKTDSVPAGCDVALDHWGDKLDWSPSPRSSVLSVGALDVAQPARVTWTHRRVQPPLKFLVFSLLEVEWWSSLGESWNIYAVGECESNFVSAFFCLSVENRTVRIARWASPASFVSNCICERRYGRQGFF